MTPEDDAAWRLWRSQGVGASDVAAASQHRYGGAYGVVASKLGGVKDTANQDRKDLGHAWEDRLAAIATAATGLYVVGEQTWCEHPDRHHLRATVDGFLADAPEVTIDQVSALLELKTRHPNAGDMWPYYVDQVQYQMLVTGVPRAVLVEGTVGNDGELSRLNVATIDADPWRQDMLADVADWLWGHVLAGTYPDPDTADALDAVKARHNRAVDEADEKALEPVDLTDLEDAISRHKALAEAEKAAEAEKKLLEAQIREALGQRRRGVAPGWTVSLSAPTRVLTDNAQDAFLQLYPDCVATVFDRQAAEAANKTLLDELKEAVGHRTLRITRKKQP